MSAQGIRCVQGRRLPLAPPAACGGGGGATKRCCARGPDHTCSTRVRCVTALGGGGPSHHCAVPKVSVAMARLQVALPGETDARGIDRPSNAQPGGSLALVACGEDNLAPPPPLPVGPQGDGFRPVALPRTSHPLLAIAEPLQDVSKQLKAPVIVSGLLHTLPSAGGRQQ